MRALNQISLVGCAGSGKTRRIVDICNSGEYDLQRTTVLSFSRAAADELRHRLPPEVSEVSTFHALCKRLLELVDDTRKLVMEDQIPKKAYSVALKSALILRDADKEITHPDHIKAFNAYVEWKRRTKRLDFYDMVADLSNTTYGGDLLVVDESQDMNPSQWKVLWLLAANFNTVFVAGDPDQQIYRFQGSSRELFREYINNSRQIVLDVSHRCTQPILDEGMHWLRLNRSERKLSSATPTTALTSLVRHVYPNDMVLSVKANIIHRLATGNTSPLLVLCRTNKEVDDITASLWASGIPCKSTSSHNPLAAGARHPVSPAAAHRRFAATDIAVLAERFEVCTIHAAKGIERDDVILFNSPVAYEDRYDYNMLMYVGITRAKHNLTVYTKWRRGDTIADWYRDTAAADKAPYTPLTARMGLYR